MNAVSLPSADSQVGRQTDSPPRDLRGAGSRAALGVDRLRHHTWLIGWLATALIVSLLPLVLATCCAPAGRTGFGTAWFVNDFAQYESAMRQGAAQADWLVGDPFTAEPHQPAFMFGLYVGLGKIAGVTGISATALERITEVSARVLLVLSLWRFVRDATPSIPAARAALLLALFGGGVGIYTGLLGQLFRQPSVYAGSWSYETNGFGLLFAAPHVPLAMAATLELARWLVPGRRATVARFAWSAALGAALAVLHPFHVPVLLAALGIVGAVDILNRRGPDTFLAAMAAGGGALPALLPTAITFTLDSFWGTTYTVQNLLPSPLPHELFVDVGATLVLALIGLWLLRQRVAPFGLLIWLLLALLAMYLPLPYQRRFAFGAQPALAALAGTAVVALATQLARPAATRFRLAVTMAAASGTVLVFVSIVASTVANAPIPVFRSTADLDNAAGWLASRVQPGDVILADWDASNYLAARTDGSVFGGHPVATLEPGTKRLLIRTYFDHRGDLAVARVLGADWVVFGPAEANMVNPPGAVPVFQSGLVRVFGVPPLQ